MYLRDGEMKDGEIEKKRKNIYIYIHPKSTRPLMRKEIKNPHLQSEFLLIHVQVVHETERQTERERERAPKCHYASQSHRSKAPLC